MAFPCVQSFALKSKTREARASTINSVPKTATAVIWLWRNFKRSECSSEMYGALRKDILSRKMMDNQMTMKATGFFLERTVEAMRYVLSRIST